MKSTRWLFVATLAIALVLCGCSSAAGPWPEIHVGDTPETVRAAFGNPAEKQEVPDVPGHQFVWIYTNIHPALRERTGWSEIMVPGIRDQNNAVVQEQVTHDIYRPQESEDLRVSFTDGLVSSVEYLKR